jgi:phosphate:Na+ symporter
LSIFNIITLLGGLAMFLYGMRLMGDSLKEGSSGTLKKAMEKLTGSPVRAFLLGLGVTALIQSSTATIVITSGLVAAGILSLHQSLGVVIGANVGTTVTGQIIRLLDIDSSAAAWLQIFRPSTLAPVALVIGIVLIMFVNYKNSKNIGAIAIGFGILFSGLLNMTSAVDSLADSGAFNSILAGLGRSPVIGYLSGAGVAFVLQSSSATIGILQAFSMSGLLTFKAIYAVIVGIYLGDCVTTAIVCSIGAKAEARRVGVVNILFNLSETVVVLVAVTVLHKLGLLDSLWDRTVHSGTIANTNTIFNLGCAILLFPMLPVYEKLAHKLVRNAPGAAGPYDDKLQALSPTFFSTPALALNSCYDALHAMFTAAVGNLDRAYRQFGAFDGKVAENIRAEEDAIDALADGVGNYLVKLSPHIKLENQVRILDQYYKLVTEFERLGDHAMNIAEIAEQMNGGGLRFSETAEQELRVLRKLIGRILTLAESAFVKRDEEAANHIEPLEEVVDDMVATLKEFHIDRLREGKCGVDTGTFFLNLLAEIERISDVCSNIGISTLTRVHPDLANRTHEYSSSLHRGSDERFNSEYHAAHDEYFALLRAANGSDGDDGGQTSLFD